MKRLMIIPLLVPLILGSFSKPAPVVKQEIVRGCVFYDGEGNKIPFYAVESLVKSEFVMLKKPEIDTITKYFYFETKHYCPFRLCPMLGQIRFHGCGSCKEGDECWIMDMVHWDHPTWSYDECDAWSQDSMTLTKQYSRFKVGRHYYY